MTLQEAIQQCHRDKIYYRYADPDYSISENPLTEDDCKLIKQAITLLDCNGCSLSVKHEVRNADNNIVI